MTIYAEGECVENHDSIDGWELYEVTYATTNSYTKVAESTDLDPIHVEVESSSKIYSARAYALNGNNERIYSGYSNIKIITNNN